MKKYQYHAYNNQVSVLVTVPIESHEYATGFAKRTAMDFYGYEDKQLEDLKVEFVCGFHTESVINLKLLSS